MGAVLQTATFRDHGPEHALKRFREMRERLLRRHGDYEYGGHLGLKDHVELTLSLEMPDARHAESWIDGHGEKWGPAVGVRFRQGEAGDLYWMVGGWCPE